MLYRGMLPGTSVSTTVAASIATFRTITPRFTPARLGVAAERLAAVADDLTLINPGLHADHAIRRMGFGEPIIDIGAQCVQRQLALQIPLAAGDFSAI